MTHYQYVGHGGGRFMLSNMVCPLLNKRTGGRVQNYSLINGEKAKNTGAGLYMVRSSQDRIG